ncbi:MAG: serine--tRNA ligase, partial [Gammaproteobacteria bacterium]|jgi:seryl-tRNA synthetase|nr:serine--tRNA ligase [Gammaproteobacteria bacterium]
MLDPKLFRDEAACKVTAERLAARGYQLDLNKVSEFEQLRKSLQTKTETLQSERNSLSKQIGQAKSKGEEAGDLLKTVGQLGEALKEVENRLVELQSKMRQFYYDIPNLPHETVPRGANDSQNQLTLTWGEIPQFAFTPKDHIDLGMALGWFDFEKAAQLSGARFVVMYGNAVRLHRALIAFMIDLHRREHGYKEVYVPYLVHEEALYGTGQLPKFAEDQFMTKGEQTHVLIPTAEVPVTNLVRDEIVEAESLPRRYVCHTPCFRREAGSYGKDTRGMIRQHQFEKVELVWIVKPEDSYKALETLSMHAQAVLQQLQLPYRVMTLCTGDIGFAAAKTYDLEVWLPAQSCYREISSCSNTEAFQARRMQARWRNPSTGKPELVHTLNGSGLAVGRTLIAIMENYQMEDGRIKVPEVLRPYLNQDEVLD